MVMMVPYHNDTIQDKNPEKLTLAGCTSPLSPYKEVPPHPLGLILTGERAMYSDFNCAF